MFLILLRFFKLFDFSKETQSDIKGIIEATGYGKPPGIK